jgi:hypothetical protein
MSRDLVDTSRLLGQPSPTEDCCRQSSVDDLAATANLRPSETHPFKITMCDLERDMRVVCRYISLNRQAYRSFIVRVLLSDPQHPLDNWLLKIRPLLCRLSELARHPGPFAGIH